jgi:hypothetical protein
VQDDLAALRVHLGPFIEYLEADLRVFSTIRGLTNNKLGHSQELEAGSTRRTLIEAETVSQTPCVNCEDWPAKISEHVKIRGPNSTEYTAVSSVSSW